jgi:hypothetical protein
VSRVLFRLVGISSALFVPCALCLVRVVWYEGGGGRVVH